MSSFRTFRVWASGFVGSVLIRNEIPPEIRYLLPSPKREQGPTGMYRVWGSNIGRHTAPVQKDSGLFRTLAVLHDLGRVLGGSWGLSKWVNNGDNWSYCMAYRGY